MDKINNINFKGISNIGCLNAIKATTSNISAHHCLSMVLKDDYKGKHLTEFKNCLKKVTSKSDKFKNTNDDNILKLECRIDKDKKKQVILNGQDIKLNKRNMPLFTYLAKLTREITGMHKKDMAINNTYIEFEASKNLMYGEELQLNKEDLSQIFDKNFVKAGARETNKFIHKLVCEYLDIK